MSEVLNNIPIIILKETTILPGVMVHFDVMEKKSMLALDTAMNSGQKLVLLTEKNSSATELDETCIEKRGLLVSIKQIAKLPNGSRRVLVAEGVRVNFLDFAQKSPFISADVEIAEFSYEISKPEYIAAMRVMKQLIGEYALVNEKFKEGASKELLKIPHLDAQLHQAAIYIPTNKKDIQNIINANSIIEEFQIVSKIYYQEIDIAKVKNEIMSKVKEKLDKNQRDYVLREQIKTIREELGETGASEADRMREELSKLNAKAEIKEKIEKEISHMQSISGSTSEYNVVRSYIETLLALPWDNVSVDTEDIVKAQEILDRDHYGMEKVKERIIEFLAVKMMTKGGGKGTIMCLVGPPGTGKTSIAKSVAESLGKKYVRICLGGVKDESEIRGHRKTYVGAMPGRIATALKQVKVSNPLMLLDEIDKLGNSQKGDPASAMLEVLDSEQNSAFRDNYIELPIDLSKVFFIATANDASTIPKPLLDRMEIIDVSSYTAIEKYHIAKDYLVAKQRKENGLKKSQLSISKKALESIIANYTREAGVRKLEQKIGKICRKTVRMILEEKIDSVKVKDTDLEEFLGKPLHKEKLRKKDEIGLVRGLAWTSVGGTTLDIEVAILNGKGKVELTGKLGDVMKESASAAITYVRSIASKYNIEEDYFEKHDIHIHVPEGATPKDGPSAGITMALAVLSAVIEKPVRGDVAMTGEITLRGRVLPIGGVREKLLAAKMAGAKTVFVPKQNVSDVAEVDSEIKEDLEIIFVDKMQEVIDIALVK
ncbi:MAG: endopeptidase La [Lachnospiraceae bacterium]|nr:endopeptidase La [Lachnospiraceae bacterium]